MQVGALKEGAPPGRQENSAGIDYENIWKKPGSLMSFVGSGLLGRCKTLRLAKAQASERFDVLVE